MISLARECWKVPAQCPGPVVALVENCGVHMVDMPMWPLDEGVPMNDYVVSEDERRCSEEVSSQPLFERQPIWCANLRRHRDSAPVVAEAMIDCGSGYVIMRESLADDLDLVRIKLKHPIVAVAAWEGSGEVVFTESVTVHMSSRCDSYVMKPVVALLTKGLHAPMLLGQPVITHSNLLVAGELKTVLCGNTGWDLMNENHAPIPRVSLRKKFRGVKLPAVANRLIEKKVLSARKAVLKELKWKIQSVRDDLKGKQAYALHRTINAIPLLAAKIEQLASKDKLVGLDRALKDEFRGVFSPIPHAEHLPLTDTAKIQLKNAEKAIHGRTYSCPRKFNDHFRVIIQQRLDTGFIRPSNSQYVSPSFLVPKPDPKAVWRWVCDYRQLNDNTVPDNFPLPKVDDILRDCAKGKIWGKIDMTDAFFQTRMDPESIKYTAVSTPFGAYEWLVMPMGFRNAPSIQQRRLTTALRHLIGRICHVYLDDILLFGLIHLKNILIMLELFLPRCATISFIAVKRKQNCFVMMLIFWATRSRNRGLRRMIRRCLKLLTGLCLRTLKRSASFWAS